MMKSIFKNKRIAIGISFSVIVAVIAFLLFLPRDPQGYRQKDILEIKPFVAGTSLNLKATMYSPDAPDSAYFCLNYADAELLEILKEQNPHSKLNYIGQTADEHRHYLILNSYETGAAKDYYYLVSYGQENLDGQLLYRYAIKNLATTYFSDQKKVVQKILFPSILIEDADIPFLQLVAGERYALVSAIDGYFESPAKIVDFLGEIYTNSQWYEVIRVDNNTLIITPSSALSNATGNIENELLFKHSFKVTISEEQSEYIVVIENA